MALMVLFAFVACDNGNGGGDDGENPEANGEAGYTNTSDGNSFVGTWETTDGENLVFMEKAANQPGDVTGTLLPTDLGDGISFKYITTTNTVGMIKTWNGSSTGDDVARLMLISGKIQYVPFDSEGVQDASAVKMLTKRQ